MCVCVCTVSIHIQYIHTHTHPRSAGAAAGIATEFAAEANDVVRGSEGDLVLDIFVVVDVVGAVVVVVVGGSEAVDAVGGSVAEFAVGSSQDERLQVSSVLCAPLSVLCAPLFPTVSGCLLLTFFSCAASCAPLFPDSKKKFCKYFVLIFLISCVPPPLVRR
jgi:hypothetical protein